MYWLSITVQRASNGKVSQAGPFWLLEIGGTLDRTHVRCDGSGASGEGEEKACVQLAEGQLQDGTIVRPGGYLKYDLVGTVINF